MKFGRVEIYFGTIIALCLTTMFLCGLILGTQLDIEKEKTKQIQIQYQSHNYSNY